MDVITLGKLNRLKNSGGVGYSESGDVLTFDGNVEGKETFDGLAVHISDTIYDLSTIKSAKFIGKDGSEYTATSFEVVLVDDYGSLVAFDPNIDIEFFVVTATGADGVKAGTYLLCTDYGYVSRVEFETVHTIDPKYISGVTLPCVTLTTIPTAEGAALTEAESAELTAAFSTGTPVVVEFTKMDGEDPFPMSHIFTCAGSVEWGFFQSFAQDLFTFCVYGLSLMDGVWKFYEVSES